ncbi:MAG: hypothetical protein M1840_003786 [Geoglossum simile]|nr:MAG: hypothetical protein M1840_003786 [Geoglossum simile]
MDHFPLPKGAQPIPVPNNTVQEYSKGDGGFAGYPARCKWSPEDLKGENEFGNRQPKDVEAFFQTWLYFGAIIEFLSVANVSATIADFIHPSKRLVSSKSLPSKLRRLNKQISAGSKEQQRQWHQGTTAILDELSRFLCHYCSGSDSISEANGTAWPVSEEISMSMIALAYTLGKATPNSSSYSLPTTTLLRRCIMQTGWCPMDVQRMEKDMAIDGHYYTAGLSKPLGNLSHENCSSVACLASSSMSEDTYVVKHTDECCDFGHGKENFIEIEVKLVVEILKAGGFPVVSWIASENKLEVKEFNADKDNAPTYVAISHVWADGMGNPIANSLPRCQLVRLQRMVNNIAPHIESPDCPIPFWIDTLCIPVANHLKEYRALSIRRMKDIYEYASAALVIESQMNSIPWGDAYDTSLGIYFSNWNRRLWTFQEGMLTQKLMLQFADRAIDYREEHSFHDEHKKSIR